MKLEQEEVAHSPKTHVSAIALDGARIGWQLLLMEQELVGDSNAGA